MSKRATTSPVHVRRSCVAKSTKKEPSVFPELTMDQFLGLSPSGQKNIYDRGKKTLNQLDDIIKQDKLAAQRMLFANAAGSSHAHTSSPKTTPKKDKKKKRMKAEPEGWSPDCGLSPGNPKRDGHRPALRMHVDLTPDGKKKPILVD